MPARVCLYSEGLDNVGENSVAKRVLRCAASWLGNPILGKLFLNASNLQSLSDALKEAKSHPDLLKLGRFVMRKAKGKKVRVEISRS